MSAPTITVLRRDDLKTRYRISGGDLTPEWAATLRPGRVAWCEITVWHRAPTKIVAYGGEVWPSAWPTLFTSYAGTAQTGPGVLITDEGMKLLDAARLADDRDRMEAEEDDAMPFGADARAKRTGGGR